MPYLLDTNVLLRLAQYSDPAHPTVAAAIQALSEAAETLHMAPQNLIEAWNVATRPVDKNGFGLSPVQTGAMRSALESAFLLLPEHPGVYPAGCRIVDQVGVSGVQVHDAHLVAFILVHGIGHILTLNSAHFTRYAPLGIVSVVGQIQEGGNSPPS